MKNDATNLRIVESSRASINDINKVDSTFEVKSRLAPYMREGQFGYTLEAVPAVYRKSYRNDEFDYTTYIGNTDKIVYLAYIDGEAVGQIALRRWWSRLAWIEDIRVEGRYRRMRVRTKLMDAAIGWARKSGMPGIMIETQDTNAPACLLYQQYGFSLGGVDRMLCRGTENPGETALFWYLVVWLLLSHWSFGRGVAKR